MNVEIDYFDEVEMNVDAEKMIAEDIANGKCIYWNVTEGCEHLGQVMLSANNLKKGTYMLIQVTHMIGSELEEKYIRIGNNEPKKVIRPVIDIMCAKKAFEELGEKAYININITIQRQLEWYPGVSYGILLNNDVDMLNYTKLDLFDSNLFSVEDVWGEKEMKSSEFKKLFTEEALEYIENHDGFAGWVWDYDNKLDINSDDEVDFGENNDT